MLRRCRPDLAAVSFLVLLTTFLMGPVLWHINDWLYGIGYDGVGAPAELARRLIVAQPGARFGQRSSLIGAPFPYPNPGAAADPLWWTIGTAIAHVLSPVGGTNMLIFAGFVGTVIASYVFLRGNSIPSAPAIVGALIYGFCPIRLAEAQEHFLLLDGFWFVFESALLLTLVRRPQFRWAALLGGCIALTDLDNPYLGYFAGVFAACWFVAIGTVDLRNRDWTGFRKVALQGAIALGVLLAVVLPTQWDLLTAPKAPYQSYSQASSLDRSISDLDRLSLRWWNFYLPFPESPILGPLGRSAFFAHLGVDTVTEQSTMTGYIALALALIGTFFALRQKVPASSIPGTVLADTNDLHQPGEGVGLLTLGQRPGATRKLATLALVCISSGIIFGLPPRFRFGSLTVPTPPYFVHAVLPEIRTTSRIDLVIQLGVAILAAIGTSYLLGKVRTPRRRNIIAGVLTIGILLEYINVPPWRYVKLLPAPPVYHWLAGLSSQQAGIVAQFPLEASDLPATTLDTFYAYDIYHHPLFNGVLKGTVPDVLRRNLLDPLNPTSATSWAALGVKTVTMATGYFDDLYRQAGLTWDGTANGMAAQLSAAYHLAYEDSTTRGYQVNAAPAPLLVGLPEHYGDSDLRADGRLWQRIGTDNMLWLDNVTTHSVRAVVWTLAHNNSGPHAISWPGYAPVPVSTANDSSPVAMSLTAAPGMHSAAVHVAGVAPPMPGTGNPTAVTVELRSLEPAPVQPLDARFVEVGTTRWTLSGMSADACTIQAGGTLDVALLWHVNAATLSDQTVFVHLLNGAGKLVAQADGLPDGGTIATAQAGPPLDVSDAHALSLPRTLPPGRYQIAVGLYNAKTMVRLQLAAGGDTVNIGSINVIAPSNGPKRIPCSW